MKCPIDQTTLAISERQGIEIDYCPTCRGVWLDRGELDKLINKENSDDSSPEIKQTYADDDSHKYHKKRKRESFLSEIFDF